MISAVRAGVQDVVARHPFLEEPHAMVLIGQPLGMHEGHVEELPLRRASTLRSQPRSIA
jgi:hypothetical protein